MWVAAGQGTDCHGRHLSWKNKSFSMLPCWDWSHRTPVPLPRRHLNKDQGFKFNPWKRVHLGPASVVPIIPKVLVGCLVWWLYTWTTGRSWRLTWFLALRWRRELDLSLEMWPLRSLEETTLSEHSVVIISWNIHAAKVPRGRGFF